MSIVGGGNEERANFSALTCSLKRLREIYFTRYFMRLQEIYFPEEVS